MYTYIHTHTYIHIYIYIEREIDRFKDALQPIIWANHTVMAQETSWKSHVWGHLWNDNPMYNH